MGRSGIPTVDGVVSRQQGTAEAQARCRCGWERDADFGPRSAMRTQVAARRHVAAHGREHVVTVLRTNVSFVEFE